MPRYFFDVSDGGHTVDEVGDILSDIQAAEAAVIRMLFDIGRDDRDVHQGRALTITARDEAGQPFYRATLGIQTSELTKPE